MIRRGLKIFDLNDYSPELINNLSALISSSRLPHAIIIDGGSMRKRQNLGSYLAMALVCSDSSTRPCKACNNCRKALNNSHPDIITVVPEDNKKTISVDIIRNMHMDAYVMPNEADKKIYIIEQADTMQPYAQNALLKILEEPPEFISFILLCETHTILLPTVLSRSAVFCIGAAENEGLSEKKRQQALDISSKIVRAFANDNEQELLIYTGEFDKNMELLDACVLNLELIFRDALLLKNHNENLISNDEAAKTLSQKLSQQQLINSIEAVRNIKSAIDLHANNNLTLTRLCSTLINVVSE